MAIDAAYLQQGWSNPFESTMQGFQNGLVMGNNILTMKVAQQQQQQRQKILQTVANNPTYENFTKAMTLMPDMAKQLQKPFSVMNEQNKKSSLNLSTQVYAALKSGHPEVATQLLDNNAIAYANAGNQQQANSMKAMSHMIQIDPKAALTTTGMWIAANDPKTFQETFKTLGEDDRANQMQPYTIRKTVADTGLTKAQTGLTKAQTGLTKAQTGLTQAQTTEQRVKAAAAPTVIQMGINKEQAEIDNLHSQIKYRAKRLNLDANKLTTDTQIKLKEMGLKYSQIDQPTKKLINDSVVKSASYQQLANKMDDIANRFAQMQPKSGIFGRAAESWKSTFGSQDDITNLRNDYARIKNSEMRNNLPSGAASDKDMVLAAQGIPADTASPQVIASFLRGMAKMNRYNAAYEEGKAEWLASNGTLGTARKDIDVFGTHVAKGTSYGKYFSQNANNIMKNQNIRAIQQQIKTGDRPYMKYAQ